MKSPPEIDREWFAGDGSGRDASGRPKNKEKAVVVNNPFCKSDGSIPVFKRPCAQEGTQKNSVEKDKDAKDKDAKGKGGKASTAAKNKDANKDKKESKVEKTKDAKEGNEEEKKSGKKRGLPLLIDCKRLKRVGDGEAAKNGEGQAKGKNKKEKQEDLKQAKKTKGDPERVKDTTQENINRLFGLAVAALLTASA